MLQVYTSPDTKHFKKNYKGTVEEGRKALKRPNGCLTSYFHGLIYRDYIEEKLNEASVIIIIRDKYIDNEKKELSIRGLCALKQLEEKRYMLLLLGSGSRCKMELRSVERIEKGRGMLVIEYLKLISGVLIIVNSIEDSIGYYKKAGWRFSLRNKELDIKRLFKYTSFTKELLNDEDIETNRETARQNGYRMILEV